MNKKIRAIALVLAASMMFSVAGCRKDPEPAVSSATTTSAEESTTTTTTAAETSEAPSASETTALPKKEGKIEFPTGERYHYDMSLTLNEEERTIGGHVDFTFFNDSTEDWDKLCLRDYSSLFKNPKDAGYDSGIETNGAITEIKSVTDSRNSGTIEIERDKDVSVVWVPLATKLAPGEKMTLSYDFVAVIPTVADRYGVSDGVFCVTNFYPILAEYTSSGWSHAGYYSVGECFYSEISDYDVKLTVPSGMTVLSTGVETGETSSGSDKTISIFAECVRDFVFCGSSEFKLVEGDYNATHVRVAYTEEENPEGDKLEAELSLKGAIDSLAAFGAAFGEYPYQDLEVIVAPISAGGMEYPNLVIISKTFVSDSSGMTAEEQYQAMVDNVVSHEVGHQWFMGIVGSNSGMQPWLDESFASFTEYVYERYVYPDRQQYTVEFDSGESSSDDDGLYFTSDGTAVPINMPYYDYKDEWVYIMAVYMQGKEVLKKMCSILGQDEFYGIVKEYVKRNAFRNADQTDFFSVLYEIAGKDNEELNKVIKKNFDDKVQPDKFA